jgi:amino acid transporter
VFTGFETAANLAEETADPKRSIPRAIMTSVVLVGAFYVIVLYAMETAFGFDMSKFLDLANFPPLYTTAATPGLGSSNFGELVQWLVVIDILAVALGCANACSRGYYALARDGRLPKPLAVIHPTFRTPWVAALLIGAGCVVVAVVTEVTDGLVSGAPTDPGVWFRFFQFGATFGALGLILVYLLISLSGFKPQTGESRVWLVIAAVVGTASTVAATFGTLYKAPSIYALDKVALWMGVWIVAGIAGMALLASRGAFRRETAAQAIERSGE